jgi:NitT/TauT family transport system substrate-binding protein
MCEHCGPASPPDRLRSRATLPRPLTRLVAALLCALAVVGFVALAGCSAPADAPHGKIVLGFSAWPGWFPWQVAQEQGLFGKHNLDVDLRYYDNYTDSIKALADGKIDANSQTLNDTLASVSGGAKLTIVLVNDNSTGNDKIIARDGIASIADLRGKRVAVEEGTVDHYLLLLALAEANLTQQDVQLVPLATDAAAAAFAAGQVDAVGAFAPFTSTALARQGSRAIATSAEFPGAIPDHLAVSSELARSRPDQVQGLVDTWYDTLKWIKANKDAADAIMARRAGVSTEEYRSYDAGTTIFTLRQNLDAFTPGTTPAHLNYQAGQIVDFLVNAQQMQQRPSLNGLFDTRFVAAVTQ